MRSDRYLKNTNAVCNQLFVFLFIRISFVISTSQNNIGAQVFVGVVTIALQFNIWNISKLIV